MLIDCPWSDCGSDRSGERRDPGRRGGCVRRPDPGRPLPGAVLLRRRRSQAPPAPSL